MLCRGNLQLKENGMICRALTVTAAFQEIYNLAEDCLYTGHETICSKRKAICSFHYYMNLL